MLCKQRLNSGGNRGLPRALLGSVHGVNSLLNLSDDAHGLAHFATTAQLIRSPGQPLHLAHGVLLAAHALHARGVHGLKGARVCDH